MDKGTESAEQIAQRLRARREANRKKQREASAQERQHRLNRRFGDDDRSWTEKNARWRKLADVGSWLAQSLGMAGAAYGVFRLMYKPDFLGISMTILSILILAGYILLERWTSDEFWDSYWIGKPSYTFGFLNFGLIAPLSIFISLLGIYLASYDTAGGPQFSNDPEALALQQKVIELRQEREEKETALAAWRDDPKNQVSSGRDKGKIYYNKVPQENKQVDAIASVEAQIAAAEQQLSERYGIVAIMDTEILAHHQFVMGIRSYVIIGFSLLVFILFEVCMRYRSKYDAIEYEELQAAAGLAVTPNGSLRRVPSTPTPPQRVNGNF